MKCDYCKKQAIVNYQKVWTRYSIKNYFYTADDAFDSLDIVEPTADDNLHLCKVHERKFLEARL